VRSAAWFLILFGSVYLIAGLGLFKWHSGVRQTWPASDAVSEGARVVERSHNRRLSYAAEYDLRYQVNGRDYVTPVTPQRWSGNRAKAEMTAAGFAKGTAHVVWYDPENPHSIRQDVDSVRLFILPIVFTTVGGVLLAIGILLYRRPIERKRQPERVVNNRGSLISASVFAILGLIMLAGNAWWIFREYVATATWTETTGTVIERQFRRRTVNGSPRFDSQIQFEYEVAGARLRNSAPVESSSNYAPIRRRFDWYQQGSRHSIRYDPANPTRIRPVHPFDFDQFMPVSVIGAIGLTFFALGCGVLIQLLSRRGDSDRAASAVTRLHR
jgi:hypothetical protein